MNRKDHFIVGRIKSIGYAFKGFWILITTEHSIITQLFFSILFIFAGFWFEITAIEWMMQIFGFGLLLTAEGLNTAVEEIADFIHPDHHQKIGKIKDISAGAVTFAALALICIVAITYLPKLI